MDDYERVSDEDLEWLKNDFPEYSQDEEWWERNQLEQMLNSDTWGPEFNEDEKEEMLETIHNAYVFAEDIPGNKGSYYHIALFRKDPGKYIRDARGETFLSLDDFLKKPIVTLGRLNLVLRGLEEKAPQNLHQPGLAYINGVPSMFNKNKNYRPLYYFERSFVGF